MTKTILYALAGLALAGSAGLAQEQPPPPECNVNTIQDKDTGRTRPGVAVCHQGNSGSVTVQVDPNFFKYPIGQSDKSVAKQVGNAVHHFFSHL